ncbi:hypothetical protein AcW1_010247 [Taiwanofungus camphoratus]|nr:hypothetical protein AcW1_010247 [Antrodia cinnamomea]
MSHRAPAINMPINMSTAHSLALLFEYTHTLDSLPLDLSRNFADLRELDAVLSSSMTVLTAKITQLTIMIENNLATKEERLWLLTDIADEANRLKLGGEDKIRVACLAADGLRGHKTHMKALLNQMPDSDFESLDLLGRKTVYPHVAKRAYMPLGMAGEGSRRNRRGGYGSLLTRDALDASPNKRKRPGGRDDESEMAGKTPRKEKTGDARQRNGARSKKNDRVASPTESLLSVASHLPVHQASQASRQNASGRGASSLTSNKRSRAAQNGTADALSIDPSQNDIYNAPPSSSASHPSLPIPYANGLHGLNGTRLPNGVAEWTHGQLEGPGMPVARNFVNAVGGDTADGAMGAGAEAEADPDDGRTYCFCDSVSYGDMIACDDANCEREWFHLPCIGLTVPPDGTWYCEACRAKRNARRSGRGGKKRSGGGRLNARNNSA